MGPFPPSGDRIKAWEKTLDGLNVDLFSDERNWEKLKKEYPDLWRQQTFATWEEVRASLPPKVVGNLTDTMYFRRKDNRGNPVKTTVFFDTGNHIGSLLSDNKLEALSCTMDDVNIIDVIFFRSATGAVSFTLGSITLERAPESTTMSGAPDSPTRREFLKFHVWKDPIGLGDIMFGRDEKVECRPGKDGSAAPSAHIPCGSNGAQ